MTVSWWSAAPARKASRESQKPGSIGSQKLNTRNSSVADRPAASGTPAQLRVATAASNAPSPPGTMPTLRNTLASMKLAKMPAKGAAWPTA